MTSRKGISLLELIITLAILLVTLPLIYTAFIHIQKFDIKNQQKLQKEAEFQWIEYVFRKDMKQITLWQTKTVSKLAGKTCAGSTLIYQCDKNVLKRTIQNPNSNTEILNKLIKITSFKIVSDEAHIISFQFETDCGPKIIVIRLN